MIKTKLIKKDKFNKSYNVIGDFDLFLKLSNKYKIQSIQDPLAFYREHKQNYSKLKSNQFIKELIHWTSINSKKKEYKDYSFFKIRILIYKLILKRLITYIGIKI